MWYSVFENNLSLLYIFTRELPPSGSNLYRYKFPRVSQARSAQPSQDRSILVIETEVLKYLLFGSSGRQAIFKEEKDISFKQSRLKQCIEESAKATTT